MLAIILGIILIAFTVVSCIPSILGWGEFVILFLKGAAPVAAALIGLVSIMIGYADIKDKMEARKEELENQNKEE